MRDILHVDMNSFFASCEQAVNNDLKDKALIVGGDPEKRRGIVLASSYEAKAYGVKTAMPIWQAVKLCPKAIVIQPTYKIYTRISKEIMKIFDDFTPKKQQISIDEAFLDMTGTRNLFGTPYEAAQKIQARILNEVDIPCSVGISSNKLLAKMASDYKKPMGITTIYPSDVERMLSHLDVGELYGVGKKTAPQLKKVGINTIGDLGKAKFDDIKKIVGSKQAWSIIRHAKGIDDRPVDPLHRAESKSISNEITFSNDISDIDILRNELLLLSDHIGFRIRRKLLKARTVFIKVKYSDFKVITRSITLDRPTNLTQTIFGKSNELLSSVPLRPIRLIGVGVGNIDEGEECQISIFDDVEYTDNVKKEESVDKVFDSLRERFGYNVVKRGSLINNGKKPRSE